jgi:hypothetical protein
MKFIALNHQHKADILIDALRKKGHLLSLRPIGQIIPHFCLTDHSVLIRRRKLEQLYRRGLKFFFQYPHTARPNLINDIYDWWPHITAEFVSAQRHIDVIRRYRDVPKNIHVIGWHLCPLCPFHSTGKVREVLFAPIHPRNTDLDQRVNREVFDRLYKLAKSGIVNLTVRYLSTIEGNGLQQMPGVKYIIGGLEPSWDDIDTTDVVVSHQTYAWLAVARGIPTVMMAEDMPTHTSPRAGPILFAKNWDTYKDLLMYPLDILNYDDPMTVLTRAVTTDEDIRAWRTRMIGNDFDSGKFVRLIEEYCHGRR